MPRYSDHWPTNTRPAIGLGHDRRAPAESYGQPQPVSAWESSTQNYGTGSAYGSNQQQSSWRDGGAARYDGYGGSGSAGRASTGYREDPYYAQQAAPARQANYYSDYEPPQQQVPAVQYGEYNLAEPLGRPAPYGGEYASGYDRGAYNSYQPPAPRPLFDTTPQYRRRGGAYFNEGRTQRSFGPPKNQNQQRPQKRTHEQSKQRQPNRGPNQKQTPKKQEEAKKPKNGGDEDEGPDEKQPRIDSRFLFEKTNDAAGLCEKANTLGEARHRQFRYKIYRVLNTLGLDFVTIIEQAGTFAKTGKVHTRVLLKNFFPHLFFGEADGTEHENACYKASVQLALKLHEFGLISCETISNFYNKKLHYKTELFERSKAKIQLLIDEVAKHQFSAEFKEGNEESAEQMQLLQDCIKVVAEKIREQEKELEAQKTAKAEAKPAEAEEVKPAEEAKVEPEAKTADPVPTVDEPKNGVEQTAESMETEPAKEA